MKNLRFVDVRIDAVDGFPSTFETSHQAIRGQFWDGVVSYACDGHLYRMTPVDPVPTAPSQTLWERLAERFGIASPISIRIEWQKSLPYDLDDLRAHILQCVDSTDDLYLSYHTEEQVRNRIAAATTFEELHDFCFEMVVGPEFSEPPAPRTYDGNKPCPHCGKPLRSNQAKQCLECGSDWH